jgi:hypothetical protein
MGDSASKPGLAPARDGEAARPRLRSALYLGASAVSLGAAIALGFAIDTAVAPRAAQAQINTGGFTTASPGGTVRNTNTGAGTLD